MNTLRFYLLSLFKRAILRDLSWYLVAQIAVQFASFISVIIVARYLGPSNLGLYSFVQNYVGTFLIVAGSMDFYFTWKIATSENPYEDLKDYMGHKLNIYILLSLISIIFAWIIVAHDVALMITILSTPIFIQTLNIFSLYAVAINRAKLISIVQMVTSVVSLAMKVSLVFLHAPLLWFIVIAAIDLISAGVIISGYFLKFPEWRNALLTLKPPSLLRSLFFLYTIRASVASVFLWQLLLRIDQLLLPLFSNAYMLGIYSATVKMAEVPNFLAGVLSTALISRMAYLSNHTYSESKERTEKIMKAYLIIGIVIAFFLILTAPVVTKILYGHKFLESASLLRVYALSIPAVFMNYFFINMYGSRNKYYLQALFFGIALAVNAVLVFVLTPIYGLTGTAIATVVAYTTASVLFYYHLVMKK